MSLNCADFEMKAANTKILYDQTDDVMEQTANKEFNANHIDPQRLTPTFAKDKQEQKQIDVKFSKLKQLKYNDMLCDAQQDLLENKPNRNIGRSLGASFEMTGNSKQTDAVEINEANDKTAKALPRPIRNSKYFYKDIGYADELKNSSSKVNKLCNVFETAGNAFSSSNAPAVLRSQSPVRKNLASEPLKEQTQERYVLMEDTLDDLRSELFTNEPLPTITVLKLAIGSTASRTPNLANQQSQKQQQQRDITVAPPKLCCKYGLVNSLIYWRNAKKSSIVFIAGLLTLLAISRFSVMSVFAYFSLTLLTVTVAFRIYSSTIQSVKRARVECPLKTYLGIDLNLSDEEEVEDIAGAEFAQIFLRLFLVKNFYSSIKFVLVLYIMTFVGAWFSGMTLLIFAFVSVFTLPKLYESKKQLIDAFLNCMRRKMTKVSNKIKNCYAISAIANKEK